VQEAAAFAIGQTGTALSEPGRRRLEDDLLRNRLHATTAAERLIEEIGKFGTREALDELMLRVGNVVPARYERGLMMAIARFAIRSVTADDAVRFLLRYLRPPDTAPWEVVYALQKVGDHPQVRRDVEQIALLRKHNDPRVRLAAATILGNLSGEDAVREPLLTLAAYDGDWRVRVNALRALGTAGLGREDATLRIFRAAFFDENAHVAVSALSACGASGKLEPGKEREAELISQLRVIAENRGGNFPWQIQAEAAIALSRCTGGGAIPFLHPEGALPPRLHARLIEAVGLSSDTAASAVLLRHAEADDPVVRSAALNGLHTLAVATNDTPLADRAYNAIARAALSPDLAVAATAASLLGEKIFRRAESLGILQRSLSFRRVPDDIEVLLETITTLGRLGDRRAVPLLREAMHLPDNSVARASATALRELTGANHSSAVPRRSLPLLTDFDFEYLFGLPDTVIVRFETIRGDIIAEFYPGVAPFSVMNLLKLAAQRGLYRGVPFHRVVPNFVIQGGDPRGDGWGGPGHTIRSEFSPLRYETGTVGMASAGKDTEGSQFFITHSPQPHLDGRYTILGRVVQGQDVVDRLQADERLFNIVVLEPSGR
jgi:peptidylprolyl isomerase